MSDRVLRLYAAATLAAALILSVVPASAQSGDAKPTEKPKAEAPANQPKDSSKKAEEPSDAAKAAIGPAGNPECRWLGERVVDRLARDDLDTAFRHLDLYDRFGCPGGHIQAAFRCLTRFGGQIDPKVAETLDSRVHACWINPASQPQQAAASGAQPAASAASNAQPQPAASPSPAASPTPAPQK